MEGGLLPGRASGDELFCFIIKVSMRNAMTSYLRELSRGLRWVCLFIASVGAPGMSAAQSDPVAGWPNRPIRLILPTAAGGAGDISSRLVVQSVNRWASR